MLHSGKLSVTELCDQCLQQAHKFSKSNIYITQTEALAKQQAKQSEARIQNGKCVISMRIIHRCYIEIVAIISFIGNSLGLLDGIPFSAKDNFSTAGIQTSCASKMLRGYKPSYNATVIQRFYDSGAVMVGKTNMDEFAMGFVKEHH